MALDTSTTAADPSRAEAGPVGPAVRRPTAHPAPVRVLTDRPLLLVLAAVCTVALAARLAIVESGGGLRGMGNYDDGVYFSASLALLHGRLPYRDFLFLQPPGILVVLAPFAALAPLVGDANAFVAARLGFLVLGAVNAGLVVLVLRRYGSLAAAVGGLWYALFLPAAHTERSTLLEPVGSLGTLVALAVLLRPGDPAGSAPLSRRARVLLVLAGVALGLGVMTKIFFALAALVIVVWARRRALLLLGGCVVSGVCVGALALAGPAQAWQQVVLDQVGRPRLSTSSVGRLVSVLQVPKVPHVHAEPLLVVELVVLAVLVALAVRARHGLLPVLLLAAAFPVLLSAPSYYRHYAALAATPLALVVGTAVGELARRVGPGPRRRVVGVAALVLLPAFCLAGWRHSGVRDFVSAPLPRALLADVAAVPGCVTSDDPSVLLFSGTLSRTLDQGCPFWPDTTGWLYDADAPPADEPLLPPEQNPSWQRHAYAYLTSGQATVLVRRKDGLSAATRDRIGVTQSWNKGHHVFRRFG